MRYTSQRLRAAHPELAELQSLPTLAAIEAEEPEGGNPFRYPLGMDPQLQTLASIPGALFYPLLAGFVAAAAGAAGVATTKLPVWSRDERPIAGAAAAAVAGVAGTALAMKAKKKRDGAAYVELYNKLSSMEAPNELTASDLKDISSKYMINWSSQVDGLKTIYGIFLESMIPVGEQSLRGDEAEKVRAFLDTLGLSEEDAAMVHMDVGRRLNSRAYETKDRNSAFEAKKTFQRLIYVSALVFGEAKAAFLLPWGRNFNLTPQHLFIAKRDNAKAVFRAYIQDNGNDVVPDRKFLHELKEMMNTYKVADESAEEVVGDFIRTHVEKILDGAVANATSRARNRDYTPTVEACKDLLDYRRKLLKYSNEEDLVPGLAQVSIKGGAYDVDNKRREMLDVYRVFFDETLNFLGSFTDELEADMNELQALLCIPSKDAVKVQDDIASALYKKLLRDEVRSQRIDKAESPAEVLEQLCVRTRFSPEMALKLHLSLYSKKLTEVVEKRKVTDEDEAELKRIQRILCIPTGEIIKVKKEIAGKLLKEAIDEVYQAGAKPVSEYEVEKLADLATALKLEEQVIMDVFGEVTRLRFSSYVMASKKVKNRKDAAGMLKQLVQFNVFVATPILEKLKGFDAAKKELADVLAKAVEAAQKEGAEVPGEKKPEAAAEEDKSMSQMATEKFTAMMAASKGEDTEKKGQREVNLAKDVDIKDRQQLYKEYLLSTMSSDVTELPVGGLMRKKANTATTRAENWRLGELAGVLGLSQMDIAGVHGDLTEQAYKANVQEALRGTGSISKERQEELEAMRAQLGISAERAKQIQRETKAQVLGVSAAQVEGEGFTLTKVLELADAGIDVEQTCPESVRSNLFRRELEKRVGDGTGNFDVKATLEDLPAKMKLERKYVDRAIKEVVATRKRMLLVQGISQLRQKRPQEALTSVQNLISCWRAQPEENPMPWTEKAELQDLYVAYASQVEDGGKLETLQQLLGLDADEVRELDAKAQAGSSGSAGGAAASEEDDFF